MRGVSSMPAVPSMEFLTTHAPLAPLPECPGLVAYQARDLVGLWEAWEKACGCRCETPFWGIAWPAGCVLARMILEGRIDVSGLSTLDIGAGGGIVPIAAAQAGAARAAGNDIDPVALHVSRLNAEANGVEIHTDERNYDTLDTLPRPELVTAADMFYERRGTSAVQPLLRRFSAGGSRVIIADAQRTYTPTEGLVCIEEREIAVDYDVESVRSRLVRVMEYREEKGTEEHESNRCPHTPAKG